MIADVLLPAGLAFIMLVLGLKLSWRDFAAVLLAPKALLAGLAVQLAGLPLLAAAILLVWRLPAEQAIGLMLIASCPGGVTANLLSAMGRGDTALSITLTAASTLSSLVMIPLVLAASRAALSAGAGPSLDLWPVARGVLALACVPVAIGMAVRHGSPTLAERLERRGRPLATAVFAAIVVATFASQWPVMMETAAVIGPAVLALNVAIIALAALAAAILGLAPAQAIALMIEGGMRNAALGILVSVTLLARPAISVPSITYALVMNITALALVAALRSGLLAWPGTASAIKADRRGGRSRSR